MASDFTKLPRLYIDRNFAANATLNLGTAQCHYLKNVLRLKVGDFIRLFNGREGEWLAPLAGFDKNDCTVMLKGKIREQPPKPVETHLIFAPVKKDRLDIIIEKSVELGVTDLHPVLTHRTEVRKINEERIKAQVTEATEQCERFEMPTLHPLVEMKTKITGWKGPPPILCGKERGESPHISAFHEQAWAFLIGPEGGFDDSEFAFLEEIPYVKALTLGETVLRVETAVMMVLSYAKITGKK
jgi:16S rRNA (uracil1498-N3)-methyltransferase